LVRFINRQREAVGRTQGRRAAISHADGHDVDADPAFVGVQAIAPEGDTVSPVGPLTRAKVSVLVGRSASVAVALALKATSSLIVWSAGSVARRHVHFIDREVKLLVTLKTGVPLSVT
jgi:hypothetical protein